MMVLSLIWENQVGGKWLQVKLLPINYINPRIQETIMKPFFFLFSLSVEENFFTDELSLSKVHASTG